MNVYFEEINKYKHLTLVSTNESKEKIKKHEEMWSKIRDLIRLLTKNLDDYDEKYVKIKFNSDDVLPLNKAIEIPNTIIVVRSIFLKNNRYYPEVIHNVCIKNRCKRNKKFLYFTCFFY